MNLGTHKHSEHSTGHISFLLSSSLTCKPGRSQATLVENSGEERIPVTFPLNL